MRHLFGFAICAGLWLNHAPAHAQDSKIEREAVEALQRQFKIAAEVASPCIACVVVSRSEHYPKTPNPGDVPGKLGEFDRNEFLKQDKSPERIKLAKSLDLSDEALIPDHGYAGGVVIDPSGLVLTPYHAIEGAKKIYVFITERAGVAVGSYADIHAADARSDLAVLKLIHPPSKLKAISFADVRISNRINQRATIYRGKMVGLLAIKYVNGFALDGPSVEYGMINNVRHRITRPDREIIISDNYYKFGLLLEHDIRLNSSVPGGVLINLEGEMVGLTTSTAVVYGKEIGPGFAIPIDANIRKTIETLKKGEEVECGFLGVQLDIQFAATIMKISKLTPHGPADVAGLRLGDVITRINDTPIDTYEDLLLQTGSTPAGTKVKLTVSRDRGPPKTFDLTLGKLQHSQPYIASVSPEPVFGLRVDHLSILAQQIMAPPDMFDDRTNVVTGVCVRDLAPNSPAADKFKPLGDNPSKWIITHVNGTPVTTPAEFYAAAKGQKTVKLTIRDWSPTNNHELTLP